MIMPEWTLEHPGFGDAFTTAPISVFMFLIAASNRTATLAATINMKLRSVVLTRNECVKLSIAAFTPLIFSSSGEMGKAATITYQISRSLAESEVEFHILGGDGLAPMQFGILSTFFLCYMHPRLTIML